MTSEDTVVADMTAGIRESRETGVATRFGKLFDRIDDPVVEMAFDGDEAVIRAVNPAFERVFGHKWEAVAGEVLNDIILPEGADGQARELNQRVATGKQTSAIVRRQTADGVRDFLLRMVPGETHNAFGIYSDITEQRRYERHSRVVHRVLRHNLRNDLSVILGLAESLTNTDNPSVSEDARTIAQHAERIASLRDETRPLEELFNGECNIAPRQVGRLCRLAVETATDGETQVTIDVPDNLTALTIPQLQRAVESLVENALAYAGEEPTVVVRGRETEDAVCIEVVDDGPGIPADERGPVFEDRDITQLQHGSGVGLWLSRWTVEACGGCLEYERTADGLTVVRLVLQSAESSVVESANRSREFGPGAE